MTRRQRWWCRVAVLVLALGMGAGITGTGIAAWPFTTWELFSHTRSETSISWKVSVVDGLHREADIDLSHAGTGYKGWYQLAQVLPNASETHRAEICYSWGKAARLLVPEADELRVWRVTMELVLAPDGVENVERERRRVATCSIT